MLTILATEVTDMALIMNKDNARLTVLGHGWNNNAIDSGSGLSLDGGYLKDIADLLEYDYPDNTDWNSLADDFQFDEVLLEPEDIFIPLDNFKKVIKKLDKKFPNRSHGKKFHIKPYNGKPYVNISKEGSISEPFSIIIKEKPDKLAYNSGEEIDIDGMVVQALDAIGEPWVSDGYSGGIIPNEELVLSPTKAE